MNEIADEIRELRKVKEGETQVYVDVDLKLEQQDRDTLQGMLAQLAEANKLAAVHNDLLAELVLDSRPRPRRRRDLLPDVIMTVLFCYLLVILVVQVYRWVT